MLVKYHFWDVQYKRMISWDEFVNNCLGGSAPLRGTLYDFIKNISGNVISLPYVTMGKNNIEIYEDDIVKVAGRLGIVTYSRFKWIIIFFDGDGKYTEIVDTIPEYVGNKYQNPKLVPKLL